MDEFNWIKKYNELFNFINKQDSKEYFSGSRFLKVIQEFDSSFPDYNQYIEYRRAKGLKTSRKNYFFDILSIFQEDIKNKIIERIYEVANATSKSKTKTIPTSIGISEVPEDIEEVEVEASTEIIENPRVFISYSWDSEDHKIWVLNLSKRLRENGIEVILDRYELQGGKNISHFMERALEESDKVLVIFTENYKLKADKRVGGVGFEYSILNNDIYKNISNNSKYIPILKSGSFESSIPSFIQQFIAIDMRDDSQFEERIKEVTLTLYDKPIIEKPVIGERPTYI